MPMDTVDLEKISEFHIILKKLNKYLIGLIEIMETRVQVFNSMPSVSFYFNIILVIQRPSENFVFINIISYYSKNPKILFSPNEFSALIVTFINMCASNSAPEAVQFPNFLKSLIYKIKSFWDILFSLCKIINDFPSNYNFAPFIHFIAQVEKQLLAPQN